MLSTEMNNVACNGFGGPEVLHQSMSPVPTLGQGEVLIEVVAAGLNHADLLQRQGKYPPPPGASEILGMEVSGTIVAVDGDAKRWQIGDKVCALLTGGGYARYVAVSARQCLPVPPGISVRDAAALPEAIVTIYANLFDAAGLKPNEIALIHGGASGIGTTAIQIIKALGGTVFVTVGSPEKAAACRHFGADLAIDYKTEDFVAAIRATTAGRGVDVVLDMVGGPYVNRNLDILAPFGRHISIATQSGKMAEVDIRLLMQKRLVITGSTMRGRSEDEKARLLSEIEAKIWPLVTEGKIKPVIYQSFPLKNVVEAHKVMESGAHIGKIVLEVS